MAKRAKPNPAFERRKEHILSQFPEWMVAARRERDKTREAFLKSGKTESDFMEEYRDKKAWKEKKEQ